MEPEPDRMPAQLPCVWVSAGVLNYRLCDREYECENCPLYLALRGGADMVVGRSAADVLPTDAARDEDPVGPYLAALGAGCALHLGRTYSADGLWLENEPGGALRIGLDDFTLRLLQPVDDVVLPRVGVWLAHQAPCAWVDRGRMAITLRCPVSGEVLEVQPRPVLIPPRSGEGAGPRWWFRLNPHEPVAAAAGLYHNEALLNWFLGRLRAVRDHLSAAMTTSRAGVAGPTLADGGIPTQDLEVVIGRERFEALVGTLFPLQV
jgi:glycine cleavage system H lipoate-binding protein